MERPLAAPPTAGGAWPSRRTVALLLVLLAAAIASSYWVEIVSRAFNDVDPIVHVPNYDFFQYYAGGYNWNLGLDPYRNHPGVPGAIQHPRFDTHQISGFIYPPTFLPVYGALARYTYEDARHAWLAITLSAFALLIGVALWVTPGRRLEVLGAVLLLTMASYPFIYHVHNGQVDLIAAAFTISGFLLYPRWRGWPSAALLALAVATKVTPVLILAVMVVYFRDWRLALKALLCGVALAALSLVWVHVGLYREFLFTTLPSIAVSDPSQFNQTVLRYWWKYPLVLKSVSALGYLALLFLVFVASRNRRRAPFGARRVRRGAARALRGAAAGRPVHAVLLAARLADGLRVADRAAGARAHGAPAGRAAGGGGDARGRGGAAVQPHLRRARARPAERDRGRRRHAGADALVPAARAGWGGRRPAPAADAAGAGRRRRPRPRRRTSGAYFAATGVIVNEAIAGASFDQAADHVSALDWPVIQ